MVRRFNVSGPCDPEIHYMLPAMQRLPTVRRIIDVRGYFIVHAPRQVGKTTALLSLARELTAQGDYTAIFLSLEVGAPFSSDLESAERAILQDWKGQIRWQLPQMLHPPETETAAGGAGLGTFFRSWAEHSPRPLVVFLDEIDALSDQTLISVLRQLRAGFPSRPTHFPWSVALIGMRDVRDYKVASTRNQHLNSSSPFNVTDESLTLRNFTQEEVKKLYAQHTAETGQQFEAAALERAYALTQGQPWLVNALARQLVEVLAPEPTTPLTVQRVEEAKELLIQRRDTHMDSLAERLREDRVRGIIEPMLAGATTEDLPEDDWRYVLDLGLIRMASNGGVEIANPIYREIIPRALTAGIQRTMYLPSPTWMGPEGALDPQKLLDTFLEFWRMNAEAMFKSAPYHEAAPHLVTMAFLHRVANAGGQVLREYALGTGRLDLLLEYGALRLAIELKVWNRGQRDPLEQGLQQLDGYLGRLDLRSGWLIIFDRRPDLPPLYDRTTVAAMKSPAGNEVWVIRA